MAECLDFGIGISSVVFAEINKCIFPPFFKNEIHSILLTAKNKPTKQTNSFQMGQTTCWTPAARNLLLKSLIQASYPLKHPQRPRSRDTTVEASRTVQWLNICVILRRRLNSRFWPEPQASTTTRRGACSMSKICSQEKIRQIKNSLKRSYWRVWFSIKLNGESLKQRQEEREEGGWSIWADMELKNPTKNPGPHPSFCAQAESSTYINTQTQH